MVYRRIPAKLRGLGAYFVECVIFSVVTRVRYVEVFLPALVFDVAVVCECSDNLRGLVHTEAPESYRLERRFRLSVCCDRGSQTLEDIVVRTRHFQSIKLRIKSKIEIPCTHKLSPTVDKLVCTPFKSLGSLIKTGAPRNSAYPWRKAAVKTN